ncbi:hypothetical protein P280DRAFT_409844 [Massarina eburnea CBS 473.64]|uniref:Uncharacterized protein n=1 Tax=Massarina eburnea CBS 473.64 TaxID=1395130 RepID=A0A6A6RMH9_9PLEO|nr:hypothetical protein P280DRAFT_409844 [Massarina eburnea CBS 473.64]
MSLARGLTKRMKRPDAQNTTSSPTLTRSKSVKDLGIQIDRTKISAPVALVSTTNMLSYNAPDIVPFQATSSKASTHSSDESDHSVSTRSRASSQGSRDTFTDASSVSSSSPTSPAPNHLSGYFSAANKNLRRSPSSGQIRKSSSSGNLQQLKESQEEEPAVPDVPAIPERALSHSKRAHERLAQKRSVQHLSRQNSTRSSHERRTSVDMFRAAVEEKQVHPFGKELAQLSEVAEEFNGVVRDAEKEADLAIIQDRHLAMYCAADYLAEIQPLFSSRFNTYHSTAPLAWI